MAQTTSKEDLKNSYTEFDIACAQAIAISIGRSRPNQSDFELAVQKKMEWNKRRLELGLPEWV